MTRKADAGSPATRATAREAAQATEEYDRNCCERMYTVYVESDRYGAITAEVEAATGIFEGTVHRRRADLWKARRICPFMITPTVGYKRLTPRNKPSQVFVTVEVAERYGMTLVWLEPALERYFKRIGKQPEPFIRHAIEYLEEVLAKKAAT